MLSRADLAKLASSIGRELRSGGTPDEGSHFVGSMLAQAGAVPDIVAGLVAQTRRKRPDDATVGGFAFLLETALVSLRLEMNGGDGSAGQAIDDVRRAAATALATGPAEPAAIMLVARAFGQAGLDPGPALQSVMARAMEGQADSGPEATAMQGLGAQLDGLAAQFGHDPFAIYSELSVTCAAFPAEHRLAMAEALAGSATAAMREAALGFVLNSELPVAEAVLGALARPPQDQAVSAATIDRLVLMRPWLTERRRAAVDAAIGAMRPRALASGPAVRPEITRVLASMCDGVGAQSLFALMKHGREVVMASILVKAEEGVTDAWVADPVSKREAERMTRQIRMMADGVEVSLALLRQRLAHGLAVNLARDRPPPFGLVQVAERLGLTPLHPQAAEPAELAHALLAELPAGQTGEAAERAAHRASADWMVRIGTTASWFEAGEAVEALLRPLRTRKQRTEAVLREVLPARRLYWAGLCACTAATLKASAETDDTAWREFALVARGLAADGPLDRIPLARGIAAASVDAFMKR